MIVLGLTGSIGMGKTTAADMLRAMGVKVHDSDAAVHALMAPGGAAVAEIARHFAQAVNPETGGIDRAVLRGLIGRDGAQWDRLEKILHPLVRRAQDDFLAACRAEGAAVAVLDIPLLFETGAEARVDRTICVSADAAVQRQRVLSRPGMTAEDFDFRLSRQMPDAEKRRRADFVVETGAGFEETRRALAAVLRAVAPGVAPS